MKLFRLYLFSLLLFSTVLSGCIKEDLSDCPVGLKVYFSYTQAGIDLKEVDRIDLFIFDEAGVFRSVLTDASSQLSPDYYMTIEGLSQGDYRFIAWGGIHDCYSVTPTDFTVGETTFEQVLLVLDHSSGQAPERVHSLFQAEKMETILTISEQEVILPLRQLTNKINLTTEGLPGNRDNYRFTITDCNGKYNFDHSFAPDSDFNYTIPCGKDTQGQLLSSLTVLRLAADRNPQLTVLNETTGQVLYSENLCRLINAMGNVDYEITHTFDIHLTFAGADVDVSINGWLVVVDGEIILQ